MQTTDLEKANCPALKKIVYADQVAGRRNSCRGEPYVVVLPAIDDGSALAPRSRRRGCTLDERRERAPEKRARCVKSPGPSSTTAPRGRANAGSGAACTQLRDPDGGRATCGLGDVGLELRAWPGARKRGIRTRRGRRRDGNGEASVVYLCGGISRQESSA